MNISLPDRLKVFVDGERRKTQEKSEGLLTEGIRSSGSTEMREEDWAEIRREAVQ